MKPAIMPFFLGSALAYVSYPLFEIYCRLTEHRRRIAAVLTLLSILLILVIVLFVILPTVISQVQSFINFLPQLVKKLDAFVYKFLGEHFFKKMNFDISTFQAIVRSAYLQLGELPVGNIVQRLFSGVFSVISILINLVLVPLITYYLLVNAKKIKETYLLVAPLSIREELGALIDKVHNSLSSYLIGQMLVATFVGIYIAAGLYLVGIKYALLIGFAAGVLNMIPYVGFFSGLIPSILLAIFDNGDLAYAVGVLIVFFTEVGIENLIYPIVMSKATGVNPLLVLLSIFIGGYLGGFLGIVIAVPVAVMVVPIFESFIEKKENPVAGGNNG
jgi:predicted PurR-regulated permease PerM